MLSFSFFFISCLLTIILWIWRADSMRPWWRIGLGIALASLVVGICLWPELLIIQRGLTALLMPIGLLWLGLIGLAISAWRASQRRLGWGLIAAIVILTVGANRGLCKLAFNWVEGEYQRMNPIDGETFDVVFLLGGGAGRGPEGQLNVSSSGDRVVLAGRLYHAGKAKRLVCTGKVASKFWPEDRDPSFLSYQLLRELAVPQEALARLAGRNTFEEMREIKAYLSTQQAPKAGVITSSWHMRRAMRLAEAQGLQFTPLPSDFRGGEIGWRDYSIVPESSAWSEIGLAVKEMLAGVVGR